MPSSSEQSKPCTVLFINLYTEMGGGESAIYHLLKGMDRSRFRPIMMFNQRGPFVEKVESVGVETAIIPFQTVMLKRLIHPARLWSAMKTSRQIYRYVKEHEIDVIHCTDVLSLIFVARAVFRFHIPVVYNVIFFYEWTRLILFNVLAFFFVHTIITDSHAVRNYLLKRTFLLSQKTVQIYKAINTTEFETSSRGQEKPLRQELALPQEAKLIGMIARFDTWKGHKTFLEASEILLRQQPTMRFVVVGGLLNAEVVPSLRSYYDEVMLYRKQLRLEEQVVFLSHRDDIPNVLRSLDVFVCPSFREPIPMIILEAMASGVPVVASDSGGNVEQITDGRDGFLFRTGDAQALASAILRCLASDAIMPQLTSSALERVKKQFGLRRYAADMETLYRNTLNPNA